MLGLTVAVLLSQAVTVEISGLGSEKGEVECVLWGSPAGFPTQTARGLAKVKAVPRHDGHATCRFENVPAGRFAVTLMHDENSNGRVDTNFLGIPRERYGFSNNPDLMFRAPRFDEAAFVVAGAEVTLKVAVK